MEKLDLKCRTDSGAGCKTCGYKKELLKDYGTFCRVCTRQEENKCPLMNKINSTDYCKECSWKGIKEYNLDMVLRRQKDNLKRKHDPELQKKYEREQEMQRRLEEEQKANKIVLKDKQKRSYLEIHKNSKKKFAEVYTAVNSLETKNILNVMGLKFNDGDLILDPCCGAGFLINGIIDYILEKEMATPYIIGTDIKDRNPKLMFDYDRIQIGGSEEDYFEERYEYTSPDYVIMEPPTEIADSFIVRALDEAKKGVLCFGRLSLLEGQYRYENVFRQIPPTFVYIYVDRIIEYRDGDISKADLSGTANAWFYWSIGDKSREPKIRWIFRKEK